MDTIKNENPDLEKLLSEQLDDLGAEAKKELLKPVWTKKIEWLFSLAKIPESQQEIVRDEVWLAMIGVNDLATFESRLKNRISLPGEPLDGIIENAQVEIILPFWAKIFTDREIGVSNAQEAEKPNLEQTKFEKPFTSQPTTKKIDINKKQDPYLEPIEESDRM